MLPHHLKEKKYCYSCANKFFFQNRVAALETVKIVFSAL